MNYSEKLKDPRWQKKRLEVFKRDNWKCTLCKQDDLELQVHHEKYFNEPWDVEDEFLKTLCCNCHQFVSFFNIKFLYEIQKHEVIHNQKDVYTCLFKAEFSEFKPVLYQNSAKIEPRYSIITDIDFLINKLKKFNGTS